MNIVRKPLSSRIPVFARSATCTLCGTGGRFGFFRPVRPADGALVDAKGRVHPRRFAIGPHTNVRVAGAFTRPGTNAQSLRYNDAVAGAVRASLPAAARASSAA